MDASAALHDKATWDGRLGEPSLPDNSLLATAGAQHPLKKDQIAKRKESNVSLMPEGLQAVMSLADLIAYLEAQKEKVATKK